MESTVKEFSKNALIRLNRELRGNSTPSADALCQLQQYRLSHKELAKEVFDIVLEQARLINEEAICAFRIKRLDSIIRKINRLEGSIELKSMGDIAGCRCILDTDDEVYRLMRALKNHPKLIIDDNGVNNYIKHPKDSGYKSIHIYVTIEGYGRRKVEIQLRSRVHHDWATFVEVIDLIYGTNVKEGICTEKRQEMYTIFCSLHKILSKKDEHLTLDEIKTILYTVAYYDIINGVSRLMVKNIANVRKQWADILSSCPYTPTNFYISTNKDNTPSIQAFESYADSEDYYYHHFGQDSSANQVLVCMNSPSFDSISTAYSNYILVCHGFTHRLHSIMAKAIENPSSNTAFLRTFILYYRTRVANLTKYIRIEQSELSRAHYDDIIMNEWRCDVENYLKSFNEDMIRLSIATNKFYVNKTRGIQKLVAWYYYIKSELKNAL